MTTKTLARSSWAHLTNWTVRQYGLVKSQRIASVCVAALLGTCLPLRAQVVQIDFTARVTQAVGSVPAGVSLGSTITGQVQVDLQYLPTPDDSASFYTGYYYGGGVPGYVIQFNTGVQTITLDSVNAANNAGATPGIFLYNLQPTCPECGPALQWVDFQLRDAGQTWFAYVRIADTNPPLNFLADNHFPYGLNLAASTEAYLGYHDTGGNPSFRADLTSVSMTIAPPPCTGLVDQVNASDLPAQRKRPLLASLEAACGALARNDCETASGQLRAFQHKVRVQVSKDDPALANALTAAAQALIDHGCRE
jgi:hypothetical protein